MSKNNRTQNSTGSAMVEIKNYPASLIHNHTSEDGSVFQSLSFRWKNAWASLILPEGAVSQSIMRNGRVIEGRQNIMLGDSEQIRYVSIQQDDNSYAQMPMFNKTILSAITANRQEYLRSIAV